LGIERDGAEIAGRARHARGVAPGHEQVERLAVAPLGARIVVERPLRITEIVDGVGGKRVKLELLVKVERLLKAGRGLGEAPLLEQDRPEIEAAARHAILVLEASLDRKRLADGLLG